MHTILIMVALWNRADHYIFALWFLLSFFFFPRLISASQIACLSYFHTWCGLSANFRRRSETCFRRRSETCCMRLAEKYRTQKSGQKSPSGNHRTTLLGYIFATKARMDNRKKIVKQRYLRRPRNMVNFGPLAAEIDPVVCPHPS